MDDDENLEDAEPVKPVRPNPSKTPSWIMLGFLLGALFVAALPKRSAPPPVVEAPRPEPIRLAQRPLTTIEAVFELWGNFAVWDHDRTEVALWREETRSFVECFEVLRIGDQLFFRSIERLTRIPIDHGVKPESPLLYTETAAQRAAWLDSVREHNTRTLIRATQETFGAPAGAIVDPSTVRTPIDPAVGVAQPLSPGLPPKPK